jgi:aminomethyltransferase
MHAAHISAGARMVEFSGWHMPVQYAGIIEEHNAVRRRAGLFDVSHMGEVEVRGAQALDYLQMLTCNDVAKLKVGRAQYNAITTPNGAFVDDLLIYRRGEQEYLLVINAANTPKDVAWLLDHVAGFDAVVDDRSDSYAQLALQGPRAMEILEPVIDKALGKTRYYSFFEHEIYGAQAIVSRTGYTGEDGFEVYIEPGGAERLWNELMSAGESSGLQPIGLGARDTLRLEAKMALYGNDIDDTTTVLEADLGWIVKLGKGDFIGRDVLARQTEEGIPRKLVGFEMAGKAIARHGYRALKDGSDVGRVTSGSYAPFLEKNIGLAYLPLELCEPGNSFDIEIRGRSQQAVVVPTPFYKRKR